MAYENDIRGSERDFRSWFKEYMPVSHYWAAFASRGHPGLSLNGLGDGYTVNVDVAAIIYTAHNFRIWGEQDAPRKPGATGPLLDPNCRLGLPSFRLPWKAEWPLPGTLISIPCGFREWAKDRARREPPGGRTPGRKPKSRTSIKTQGG